MLHTTQQHEWTGILMFVCARGGGTHTQHDAFAYLFAMRSFEPTQTHEHAIRKIAVQEVRRQATGAHTQLLLHVYSVEGGSLMGTTVPRLSGVRTNIKFNVNSIWFWYTKLEQHGSGHPRYWHSVAYFIINRARIFTFYFFYLTVLILHKNN